jgi:deoxyadenosine/deoxycytidine kinase
MMKRYFLSAKTGTSPVAIFERSMKVAAEVFIEDTGDQLDPIDRQLLLDQCQLGADTYESDATHVYLSCTDKEMLDRVHGRGRKSERHLR